MALVEEELPGVKKVRSDFRVREDSAIAQKLQDQEYEDHFNANVQLRRTARHDVGVAQKLQDEEVLSFRQQEVKRRDEMKQKEEADRLHAEKMAQKLKEEEDIQMALKMQDEVMAKKLYAEEMKRKRERELREQEDARLAKQASFDEQREIEERRRREVELSEREIERLRQLQLQKKGVRGDPTASLPSGALRSSPHQRHLPPQSSLPASRQQLGTHPGRTTSNNTDGPSSLPADMSEFQLPSYDDVVDDEEEEPVLDENERIARQEAEDARVAQELFAKEQQSTLAERQRREQEDMEIARRFQLEEQKRTKGAGSGQPPTHFQEDLELAKRLQQEELEARKLLKQQQAAADQRSHESDLEFAKRLQREEMEARQRAKEKQAAQPVHEDDATLAKRLQKEEVMRQRQRMAQKKMIEEQKLQRLRQQQQGGGVMGGTTERVPTANGGDPRLLQQKQEAYRRQQQQQQAGRSPSQPHPQQQQAGRAPPQPHPQQQGRPPQQYQEQEQASSPNQQPGMGLPPQGHPFNPSGVSFSTYQPAVAGVQVPISIPHSSSDHPKSVPSYKRQTDKKGKKKN